MRSTRSGRLFIRTAVLAMLCCLACARPSAAQDVWVYPEQWTEPSGDHFHGLGRYVVETAYYFDPVWAAASIHSPTGRLAGYNQNSGTGSVTVDLSLCGQNDVYDGDEGEYGVDVEFNLGGEVPQSGGWTMQPFGSARFAYILSFIHWYGVGHYVRCNPGAQCREMDVFKPAIDAPNPPPTYPLYLMMKLIWVNPNACAGFEAESQVVCVADAYLGS